MDIAGSAPPGSDLATVIREYATETRFLARRLTASAELVGPLVEDEMITAIADAYPRRVLDVGCGTGDLTARIQRELGVEVVGIDLSPRMVELTAERGLSAQQGDVQALPFADDHFDCVLANRVLYHVPDLDRGLAEIARVLTAGGCLVAVTYSDDHLRELWDLLPSSAHPPLPFSAENGADALRRQFAQVERRDVAGTARFRDLDAILSYFDSYGEFSTFSDVDLDACLQGVEVPFDATYRHCVFVARDHGR
jgi:SAM-dependent methyltransferase